MNLRHAQNNTVSIYVNQKLTELQRTIDKSTTTVLSKILIDQVDKK